MHDDGPLRAYSPAFERDAAGVLVSWRGNSAEVFPFESSGRKFVLRMSPDIDRSSLTERYAAIERMPDSRKATVGLVDIALIRDPFGPNPAVDAVVMQRVPGKSLAHFVIAHYTDSQRLRRAASRLADRITAAQSFSDHLAQPTVAFAHGDLQSGNILITDTDAVWFIDYDDVYLPGLKIPPGVGHPDYQHPGRCPDNWGRYMDTFSCTLIVATLRAIASTPQLIDLAGDTSLLFTQYDLENPGNTELWKELSAVPDRRAQNGIAQLAEWLGADTPPNRPFADEGAWQ